MIRTFASPQVATKRRANGVAPRRAANWLRYATACAIAVDCPLVASIQSDPVAVVRALAEQDGAVLRVGEQLAVAAATLCGNSGRTAGMTVQQIGQYGEAYRSAARSVLGISSRPTVAQVAPGGAADVAGVRPGDVILAIDGHDFPDVAARRDHGAFADVAKVHDVIDAALADGSAQLNILRGDVPQKLMVRSRLSCRARFDVRAGRSNNATADGTYIQVSSDLVAQARGDGELAAILAHELAHNILDHPRRLRAKGSQLKVRATEIEADRLSVYLLDAAGYGIADAVAFWGRWGRANDLGIFSDRTHPGWKKRIATIEAEAAVIAALKATGKPVRPPADLQAPT